VRFCLTLTILLALAFSALATEVSPQMAHFNRHLLAYNANKAEDYASFFHPDIEVYNYPDRVLTAGRGALLQSTSKTFERHRSGSVVLQSIEHNNKIVTHERASFSVEGIRRSTNIVKIYEFEDGLIRRMTFME